MEYLSCSLKYAVTEVLSSERLKRESCENHELSRNCKHFDVACIYVTEAIWEDVCDVRARRPAPDDLAMLSRKK